MYRLDEDAQARSTELKDLVAEANELGMTDAADSKSIRFLIPRGYFRNKLIGTDSN